MARGHASTQSSAAALQAAGGMGNRNEAEPADGFHVTMNTHLKGTHDDLAGELKVMISTNKLDEKAFLKFIEENANRRVSDYGGVQAALNLLASDERIFPGNKPKAGEVASHLLKKHGCPSSEKLPASQQWKLFLLLEALAHVCGAEAPMDFVRHLQVLPSSDFPTKEKVAEQQKALSQACLPFDKDAFRAQVEADYLKQLESEGKVVKAAHNTTTLTTFLSPADAPAKKEITLSAQDIIQFKMIPKLAKIEIDGVLREVSFFDRPPAWFNDKGTEMLILYKKSNRHHVGTEDYPTIFCKELFTFVQKAVQRAGIVMSPCRVVQAWVTALCSGRWCRISELIAQCPPGHCITMEAGLQKRMHWEAVCAWWNVFRRHKEAEEQAQSGITGSTLTKLPDINNSILAFLVSDVNAQNKSFKDLEKDEGLCSLANEMKANGVSPITGMRLAQKTDRESNDLPAAKKVKSEQDEEQVGGRGGGGGRGAGGNRGGRGGRGGGPGNGQKCWRCGATDHKAFQTHLCPQAKDKPTSGPPAKTQEERDKEDIAKLKAKYPAMFK